MAVESAEELRYPTVDELHAQLLNDLRYEYKLVGVTANVAKNSELWIRAKAFSKRASIAIANGKIGLNAVNPLKAQGKDLVELAAVFGVAPRNASPASGFVIGGVLLPALSLTIPAAFVASGPAGVKYKAVASTTISNLGLVEMVATETGARTNLETPAVLTWDSTAIGFLDQKATLAPGGFDGGHDADTTEILRQRLLRRLGFPSIGGNWSQVAGWAYDASAAIAFVAVYPTARGAGSYDVAIVGFEPTPVLNATVQNLAAQAVLAQHPGHVSLNTTSVVLEQIDVVVNLGAPLPKLAGGAGGGWVDALPWPSTAEPTVKGKVTAVGFSPSTITVDSTSADAPAAGARIALWDYAALDSFGNPAPVFRVFAVASVSGPSGAYVLTLDASTLSTSFIEVGMYVSPAADKIQQYADAVVSAIAQLGPGEKTTDADLLVYARRKPGPDLERPYNLTSRQLDVLTAKDRGFPEVTDASYAARYTTGTTTTKTSPSVPSVVSAAPRKLSVKHFAFRRTV